MVSARVLGRSALAVALAALTTILLAGAPDASADLAKSLRTGTSTGLAGASYSDSASTLATVGPLFPSGLHARHTCTAAVVDSPDGDLLVTAAHCLAGTGAGLVFAPGYDDGVAPYGTWVVQRAYVAPGWIEQADPSEDYAFLLVAPSKANRSPAAVQAVVGANALGHAPLAGTQLVVAGYVAGRDDEPVICSVSAYLTGTYPSFDCAGYAGGTSGGPWLADYDAASGTGTISGVIGGLHQGGCEAATSYTSAFDSTTDAVLARAEDGGPADTVPAAGSDGC
jgi:V8-like Glu-specific endopeptidase